VNPDAAARTTELSEIDQVLKGHPYVRSAVAGIRETPEGPQLVAYVVPTTLLSRAEVMEHCRKHLPERQTPSAVVFMPEFPTTHDGEIDYAALYRQPPQTSQESYQPPVGRAEADVEQRFAGTLGLERIGREDNFFDLGGHSLLATKIVAALNEQFGTSLTLKDVFSNPTVAGLAERMKSSQ
jgi:acyl carrier protein